MTKFYTLEQLEAWEGEDNLETWSRSAAQNRLLG